MSLIKEKYNKLPDCLDVCAEFAYYSVPEAAALWCGITHEDVQEALSESEMVDRGVYEHPYIPCLKLKCRLLHKAIIAGEIEYSRENGIVVDEHVAPERRYVSAKSLKEYISKNFPNDKPDFLFSKLEKAKNSGISSEDYLILQAKLDAANVRIKEAVKVYKKQKEQIAQLEEQITQTKESISTQERNSMLKVIAGLCKKAGINPKQRGISKVICHEIDLLGIKLSNETVKKYLDEIPESVI